MADVEHNALTDPELHEPKAIAAANSNELYVADGAGSGDFQQVSPSNSVMIHSASDLPAASGGLRTLLDNTVYQVVGSVDIGSDRLLSGSNTVIRGNNQSVDKIVSTTAGTFLTATSNSFRLYKIGFTVSSGTFMAVSGSSNSHSLREVSITADIFGTVAGNRLTDLWRSRANCVSGGLTVSGACFRIVMDNATLDVTGGSGICLDLGTATFDNIRITNSTINNSSGSVGIDIAPAGANLNAGAEGYITQTDFLTSATSTAGFTAGDPNWRMTANVGLGGNPAAGQGNIVDSALTTTFSGTGDGNDELVNFGTAFVADIEQKFTISTAGAFTYDAVNNLMIDVYISANIFATIAGGASRIYNWYIAINGTIIASSASQHEYDGTNPGSVNCSSLTTIAPGDIITLRVRAETATTTLTADTVSILVAQAGA